MLRYIYYIAYLKTKDSTEYTGIETYVSSKIDSNDNSWFPMGKALCLRDHVDEEEKKKIE